MDIDALLEPLHPDEPCGPDLKAARDPDYLRVYVGALNRLPEAFVIRGGGEGGADRVFDHKSVDLQAEFEAIDELLERSRDIRYLMLRIQWAMLAGRLPAVAEGFEAVAALLETHADAVHPLSKADRQTALRTCEQMHTMVLPLQFCGMTGSRDVSIRRIRVARGEGMALSTEDGLDLGQMMDALGARGNADAVERTHASVRRIVVALDRIRAACRARATDGFDITFDRFRPVLDEMHETLTRARPDLVAAAEPEPAPEADTPGDAEPGHVPARAAEAAPATDVTGHGHARALLEAAESYYRRHEPSSAALLLVTQARLLIGKPLLEALETLMPQKAGGAVVQFGPREGFSLDSERLRALTDTPVPEGAGDAAGDGAPEVSVTTAAEAAAAIQSVETYFRGAERSSPVPILLKRARTYLELDFEAIVNELIPPESQS